MSFGHDWLYAKGSAGRGAELLAALQKVRESYRVKQRRWLYLMHLLDIACSAAFLTYLLTSWTDVTAVRVIAGYFMCNSTKLIVDRARDAYYGPVPSD